MQSNALPIGEVSRRTGFTPDTLRYYERLGLVPAPARAHNGRRAYGPEALERLRFISRAKQLGCSLDEIASLVTAVGEDCRSTQIQMRELVERHHADAQRRVAELLAFSAQLAEARHALAGAAVDGPCGPGCACMGGAAGVPVTTTQRVPLVVTTVGQGVACTLAPLDMPGRLADWQAALAGARTRERIDGGIRILLAPELDVVALVDVIRAEQTCCPFFAFALTVDERGIAIEVRAPTEAGELVAAVFGVAA